MSVKVFDWSGREKELRLVRYNIERITRTMFGLDAWATSNGLSASDILMRGIKEPEKVTTPIIVEAVEAQLEFAKLSTRLQNEGIDFSLIRKEYATTWNPTEEQRKMCDDLIDKRRSAYQAGILSDDD